MVFLKVVGGDVLLNREMVKDEQVQSFDAKIDVVLADSTAVRVQVNGAVRPPGESGERRQEFTGSWLRDGYLNALGFPRLARLGIPLDTDRPASFFAG